MNLMFVYEAVFFFSFSENGEVYTEGRYFNVLGSEKRRNIEERLKLVR